MFWDTFVELCNKQNKKPNPVAKELGISSGAVTRWKNGSVPQSTIVHKIADYFGVSVDYLLGNNTAEEMHTPTEPKLSEGEKIWLQLYNSVSEDTRNILIGMMIAIDKLPTEEKEEALSRVRDDLKSLE